MSATRPGWWRQGGSREVPLLRLLLYYAILVVIAMLAIRFVPRMEDALLAPIRLGGAAESVFGMAPTPASEAQTMVSTPVSQRALTTFVVALGALLLTLPTAWVYMFTRRLRYDPSLVQSVVILPVVVSGIVIVVKNSLALAFSLAGIVAAVRFRNTLKDPKDAVYVFLALGIGLAAGVQALDVALVMSLTFSLLVLALWKYNIGAIYSGVSADRTVLSIGNAKLLRVRAQEDRERVQAAGLAALDDMDADGVLLVHTADPAAAHRALEVSLSRLTSEWRLIDTSADAKGRTTLTVLVDLRKKVDPAEVLGELDDRWSPHIAAAEFVSLHRNEAEWDGEDRREED